MRGKLTGSILVALTLLLVSAVAAEAQTGTLAGRVVSSDSGDPVSSAQVVVLGSGDARVAGGLANETGAFRFTVPAGTYALMVGSVGYADTRRDGIRVTAGSTTNVTVELGIEAILTEGITVTGLRNRPRTVMEVPASVFVIGKQRVQERPAVTVAEHVKGLPGVDISQTGIQQSNIVTRGFNNVFSGSLLVLADYRYAHVPSLRFNAYNLIPITNLDLEQVELLLGPAAALYGPNSASGVLHMLTTSPIDDPGTAVSLAGGERSIFHGQFRHATRFSDELGLKVTGQYFRGDDWEFTDPFEEFQQEVNPDNPLIGARDFDAERWSGEARLDWRPWDGGGGLVFSGGLNRMGSSIELTGLGAAQARDWTYSYFQTRMEKGALFAQAYVNMSDAGDTYLLRTGQPIVDQSRMWVGQIQHALGLGERQAFTYGLDYQRTEPRTGGTITGRNEDDDNIDEVGGYVHSETQLSDNLELIAALRVDHHSELEDLNWSPRVALVLEPQPNQSLRATFNRAFSTPTTNNLFLDILAGQIPLLPGVGYDIRTLGVPRSGFTFTSTCPGGAADGTCMHSPFAPGQRIPALSPLFWNDLVNAAAASNPSIAAVADFLRTGPDELAPVATSFRYFDQQRAQSTDPDARAFPFSDPAADPEVTDVERIRPTITNTFEVGYKGALGDRFLVTADVYRSDIEDFVGPLRVETPNVFMDMSSAQVFARDQLEPLVQGGAMSSAEADAIAAGFAGFASRVPLGTVTPDQAEDSEIVITYRNFGDIQLWGADVGAQVLLGNLTLGGTYSWVEKECLDFNDNGRCTDVRDVALNAPTDKASFTARWDDPGMGLTAEGRLRWSDGFPMNSGVYAGQIDDYTVMDLNLSYRLPTSLAENASISLYVQNLLDDEHQEFIGAPALGRLALLRLLWEF